MNNCDIVQTHQHCWLVIYFLENGVGLGEIEQSFSVVNL